VTGKTEKDRKERNLVSSQDKVARDSHHHGSSGIPLVHSFRVLQWWGSPSCLFTQPFIRCCGDCSLGNSTYPMFPQSRACVFSQSWLWQIREGLVSRHILHNKVPILRGWFWVVVYSLSGLYLADPPGGPAVSFANKL